MTSLTGGLEITLGQHSYRHSMDTLKEKKQELAGVKREIDRITGQWSGFFSLLGKANKADLRGLVDQEICVLGDISDALHAMTKLYGGERERLLAYFDLLEKRMEQTNDYQPEALVPIEQPNDTLSFVKSIKSRVHNGFQTMMGHRKAVAERQTRHYAEESVSLMDQCQQAYGTLILVDDQMQHAYEHLQATGPALVSLIELNEAKKVIGKSVGDIKAITGQMYATVDRGYLQLTDFTRHNRVPFLNQDTKRIEFLQG